MTLIGSEFALLCLGFQLDRAAFATVSGREWAENKVLIKHTVTEQNRFCEIRRNGALGWKSVNRIGTYAAVLIVLASMLGACSADLSLNNVTLAPKPEALPRKVDGPAWGRASFDRSVSLTELIGPDGQCTPLGPEQMPATSAGNAQAVPPPLGGISLQMTECQVVRRAGAAEKFELGANERGERSLVLTYVRGPWPGIYHFAGGRLVSIDRAPEPPPAEKPQKATGSAKKPAGS